MLKTNIKLEKVWENTEKINVIRSSLLDEKLKLNNIHHEKSGSIRLLTLPLKDEGCCLKKQLGFSEVTVWLVIITATYPMHFRSSKKCKTCFDLWFYNPETKSYKKCNG